MDVGSLLWEASQNGIDVFLDNGKLQVRADQDKQPDTEMLQRLRSQKQDIIAFLEKYAHHQTAASHSPFSLLKPIAPKPEKVPLSSSQQRLWLLHKLEGSVSYNIPFLWQITGAVDLLQLELVCKQILMRHEVLRTVYRELGGTPYQHVIGTDGWHVQIEAQPVNTIFEAQAFIDREINQPFDIENEPMLRVKVVTQAGQPSYLLLVIHHIAFDDWSLPILLNELQSFYAHALGKAGSLPGLLPLQYADFAIWESEAMATPYMQQQLNFWTERLSEITLPELPKQPAFADGRSAKGDMVVTVVDEEMGHAVKQLAQQQQTTLFTTLLAAFQTLMHLYSEKDEITTGTPVANRSDNAVQDLIGYFSNTIAVKSKLEPTMSFKAFLLQVKNSLLTAYDYQHVPYEKIVEALNQQKKTGVPVLFNSMFVLTDQSEGNDLLLGDCICKPIHFLNKTAKFDLILAVADLGGKLELAFQYKSELYSKKTIENFSAHFLSLLQCIINNPNTPIHELDLRTDVEKAQIQLFNHTAFDKGLGYNLVEGFEAQVLQTPNNTALLYGSEAPTYSELNGQVNQLANYLLKIGIGQGKAVGICLERSVEMVVTMFAVLKTGAMYVPIDPNYPVPRIDHMLAEASVTTVISEVFFDVTAFANKPLFGERPGVELIIWDEIRTELTHEKTSIDLPIAISPQTPAYVLYTSGTTGQPKGIMVSHGNVTKLVYDPGDIAIFETDHVLQWSNYVFDGSVYDIYSTLLKGATLHLISAEVARDAIRLSEIIRTQKISVAFFTTAMFNNLVEYDVAVLAGCRKILFGGQTASVAHVRKAFEKIGANVLVNVYGPTETTVYATCFPIHAFTADHLPIGKPLSNTHIQILNNAQIPVGIGMIGEICIGGAGVSLGYINNATENGNKFITVSIDKQAPEVFYRSGDLGRWLDNGEIAFLGRNDKQVKIRGYRVELGEIENALLRNTGINQAAVVAKDDYDGNKKLIAYIVCNDNYDAAALQTWLHSDLPAYMVPSMMIQMEALPLTSNGKVDVKALPEPDGLIEKGAQYVAPENEIQEAIAAIWQQLLGIERVGANNHFFEIGGHSLSAVRMIVMINQALEVDLSVEEVFNTPILKDLAMVVEQKSGSKQIPLAHVPLPERIPLSYGQEALWIIDQQLGESVQYHIPCILRFEKPLDEAIITKALRYVLEKHQALRTVIKSDAGRPYQVVLPSANWVLQVKNDEFEASTAQYIADAINKPFDLAQDYMMRALWLPAHTKPSLLVFTFHHIAFDEWSRPIFLQDFKTFYELLAVGGIPVTSGFPQYVQYAVWQREVLDENALQVRFDYWKAQLKRVTTLEILPDFPRPKIASTRGGKVMMQIEPTVRDLLKTFSKQEDCTMFMTLLACINILLHKYSGQSVICAGTPVANRVHGDSLDMVGFFVNTVAMANAVDGADSFLSVLRRVRENTRADFAQQDYPFEKIVAQREAERDLSRNPIFQVMYTYQNDTDASTETYNIAGVNASFDFPDSDTAKFDLSFGVYQAGEGLAVEIRYAADLFDASTIQRMKVHLGNLIGQLTTQPEKPLSAITLMDENEATLLLASYNNTTKDYPLVANMQQWLEDKMNRFAHLPAITAGNETLVYSQLNEKANQLARKLLSAGVVADSPVLICMDRSITAVVAVLAILKAGGAYVPVDPDNPASRIHFITKDTGAKVILTQAKYKEKFFSSSSFPCICIERITDAIFDGAFHNLQVNTAAHHSAYIIYTSGTTGNPKGVVITHQNLINYLQYGLETYGANESAFSFPLFTNMAFDLTQTSIFLTILTGGQLFVENGEVDQVLENILQNQQINIIKLTPSHINLIGKHQKSPWLQHVIVGGEALRKNHTEILFAVNPILTIYNEYGPTEATIGCTVSVIKANLTGAITIGTPISNTRIYILDENQQPVATGIKGEIYIAGAGLAREYQNNPVLTNSRFITLAVGTKQERVYKTGDLARWLPDGIIEYLGRGDEQVKIKGYRIELGEILHHLLHIPGIDNAAVAPIKSVNGYSGLVAYYVSEQAYSNAAIQEILHTHLPAYMVPGILMRVNEIPLTLNGKVDIDALPVPENPIGDNSADEAPRNELEALIARAWEELLVKKDSQRRISIHDNFFALGGDSITAIQAVNRLKEHGYNIRPRHLFENQTIASLASILQQGQVSPVAKRLPLVGTAAMTPVQHYFLATNPQLPVHYNQDILLAIDKTIGYEALQQVFTFIQSHHAALRFSYTCNGETWIQQYENEPISVQQHELLHVPVESLQASIVAICSSYQRLMLPRSGKLVQAVWITTPAEEPYNRLFIAIHHLAVDGVSWRILLADIERALTDIQTVGHVMERTRGADFAEWTEALEVYADWAKSQISYWKNIQDHFIPLHNLKTQRQVTRATVKHVECEISHLLTNQLLTKVNQAYRTEVQDILLAALWLCLHKFTGHQNIVIGLESHGRQELFDVDVSDTVGWFTTLFPVLLNGADATSPAAVIKHVKENIRSTPDYGRGYGVLQYLSKDDAAKQALHQQGWDILFNYLGQFDNLFEENGYLHDAHESTGTSIGDEVAFTNKLEITGSVINQKLMLYWTYSDAYFTHETISGLAQSYCIYLEQLIQHCVSKQMVSFTPSDLSIGQYVTPAALDSFLNTTNIPSIKVDTDTKLYPLSPLQQGILFHSLHEKESPLYREHFYAVLHGALDLATFKKTWQLLLEQHSILRTAFLHDVFKMPFQCVHDDVTMPIVYEDWSTFDAEVQEQKWESIVAADKHLPFDMQKPPLSRVRLAKVAAGVHRFLWTSHHICIDGWSTMILIGEMLSYYNALASNQPVAIQRVDAYHGYIKRLLQRNKTSDAKYWKDYLRTFKSPSALAFVRKTVDAAVERRTAQLDVFLGEAFTDQLKAWASRNNVTVNTVLQAAWALLLANYSQTDTPVFGYAVSGRSAGLEAIEQRVGLYTNTLPFVSQVRNDQRLVAWLKEIQLHGSMALEHEWITLTEVQAFTGQQGDIFDTIFAFENFPVAATANKAQALSLHSVSMEDTTNYPLTINASIDTELSYRISFETSQVAQSIANAVSHHFEYLLQQFVSVLPETLIGELALNSLEQQGVLATAFNPIFKPSAVRSGVVGLIAHHCSVQANVPAVIDGNRLLTYGDLEKQSNLIAQQLSRAGIAQGHLVALLLERSIDMIVAQLAILKCGAAYLPIDPAYPESRIGFMISDAAADALIITNANATISEVVIDDAKVDEKTKIYNLEELMEPVDLLEPFTAVHALGDALAYVIYTSGSTGTPKGVMIPHEGLLNLVQWHCRAYAVTATSVATVMAGVGFDASVWEIWPYLCSGATLHIVNEYTKLDATGLHTFINRNHITHCFLTTALAPAFIKHEGSHSSVLKYLLTGGDKLSGVDISKVTYKVFNNYGPTEASVVATFAEIPPLSKETPLIGKPVDHATIYLLDEQERLVPFGAPGEIYIGGHGLALGYIGNHEQTAQNFVQVTIANDKKRLYKTGDLAMWTAEGQLQYLGRTDQQIQLRGFRIEPAEIELALLEHPSVVQAVAVVINTDANAAHLVAYIVANATIDEVELLADLGKRLPEYMVPTLLVTLEQLPLTQNGKVDKDALPDPGLALRQQHQYSPPQGDTEMKLAAIWGEFLNNNQVGATDNFFALGGHSLLATGLVAAINKAFASSITIAHLFKNPVIRPLAKLISDARTGNGHVLPVKSTGLVQPLSYAQERLWFIHQFQGSNNYHIPMVLALQGNLDSVALERALKMILGRHEVLRSVIRQDEKGQVYQVLLASDNWHLHVHSLNETQLGRTEAAQIDEIVSTPFDLASDYMMRGHLIPITPTHHLLVLVWHHIAFDGWSLPVFMNDLIDFYSTYIDGTEPQRPALQYQYVDFANWQRSLLSESVLRDKLSFWENHLAGLESVTLPADFQRTDTATMASSTCVQELTPALSGALLQLAEAKGVSAFTLLMTTVKLLLHKYTDQEDICLGTPISNRGGYEFSDLIGFFVNTLPIRTRFSREYSFDELLTHVNSSMIDALEHQQVPFELIVQKIVKERDQRRNPLFQILFTFEDSTHLGALQLGAVTMVQQPYFATVAKFDLTFGITKSQEGLTISIEYATGLYRAETIQKLMQHFLYLLQQVAAQEVFFIKDFELLSKEEIQYLLNRLAGEKLPLPLDTGIQNMLMQTALIHANTPALYHQQRVISFETLHKKAHQLANCLLGQDVRPGDTVSLCLSRTPDLVIAMLAVLYTGSCYVPIDPEYPAERISFIINDSNAAVIITEDKYLHLFTTAQVCINLSLINLDEYRITLPSINYQTQLPAYIIYTSGTTGKPKGVMITYQNMLAFLCWCVKEFADTAAAIIYAGTSVSFDLSIFEIFYPLVVGKPLRLLQNGLEIEDWLPVDHNVLLNTVPAVITNLLERKISLNHVAAINMAGEPIPAKVINGLDIHKIAVRNLYGPSEDTTYSTCYRFTTSSKVLIGKPIANTHVYLLDNAMHLVPMGVPGEIYLGGAGVANGYLNRATLTAERFLPDLYQAGKLMYKTGDLARLLPNGELDYLGRKDDQAKIRGYRVEPAEVQSLLETHPAVEECVFVVQAGKDGSNTLVGYVVPINSEAFDETVFMQFLKERLPAFMLPSKMAQMQKLPRTPNGKVDKRALPNVTMAVDKIAFVAAETPIEKELVTIWQELMGLDTIGVHDDFFTLGGHSLLAAKLITVIQNKMGVKIPLIDVFEYSTIAKLARLISVAVPFEEDVDQVYLEVEI